MSTYHPHQWSSAADSYDDKVGRMDQSAVSRIIDRVTKQHPFTPFSYVVDLGSGTAVDMLEILARRVKAIQPTKETVDVTTHVLDAADLATHFGREFCSHVFSAFMLQYADRPRDVVRAIYQSLQPGGSLGLGLWGRKNGPMIIWSESCAETDLDHKVVKSDELLAWTDIGELETMLREGFRDMESEIQTLEFGCKTIEDLVEFWFSGSNPVARKFVQTWAEEGGDLEAVKRNYHVIVERHGDHRENKIDVILTTARK